MSLFFVERDRFITVSGALIGQLNELTNQSDKRDNVSISFNENKFVLSYNLDKLVYSKMWYIVH